MAAFAGPMAQHNDVSAVAQPSSSRRTSKAPTPFPQAASSPDDINYKPRPKSILSRLLRQSTDPLPTNYNDLEQECSLREERDRVRRSSLANAEAAGEKKRNSKWDKRASRKAPPPPIRAVVKGQQAPGPEGMAAGEELRRHQASDRPVEEEDDGDTIELDWERIKALPTVLLHPPEEELCAPISLYPPPQPVLYRPPSVPLSKANSRPTSIYSVDSNTEPKNTWGGMASSFGQPPPRFKRARHGSMAPQGVVMPKRRDEVERDRRRSTTAPSAHDNDWNVPRSPPRDRVTSPPPSLDMPHITPMSPPFTRVEPPERSSSAPPLMQRPRSPPRIMITSESTASLRTVDTHSFSEADSDVDSSQTYPLSADVSLAEISLAERVEAPRFNFADPALPMSASMPSSIDGFRHPHRGTSEGETSATSLPDPVLATIAESLISTPGRHGGSTASRKRRSMSLTAILTSRPSSETPPPLPPLSDAIRQENVVRKQKSLKKFFFSNTDLAKEERNAELTKLVNDRKRKEKEDKHRSIGQMLSRPRSKPSLRIDVRASKGETSHLPTRGVPPLTGSSMESTSSEPLPDTPSSRSSGKSPFSAKEPKTRSSSGPHPSSEQPGGLTRGLTKRFSLSNMSGAFRRSRKESMVNLQSPPPQVPQVPDVYKRDRTRRSDEVKESAVPISPTFLDKSVPLTASPLGSPVALSSAGQQSSRPTSPRTPTTLSAPSSPGESPSVVFDTSTSFDLESELSHAQLMLVSPRTRRDPTSRLQNILGVGPLARTSTLVEVEPALSRRSVECVILGPLLLSGLGEMDTVAEGDEEDAIERLEGRSKRTADAMPERFDSESSLESLSRSSSSSDPDGNDVPPVTPSSPPLSLGHTPQSALPSRSDAVMEVSSDKPSPASTIKRSPEGLFRFLSNTTAPKSVNSSPQTIVAPRATTGVKAEHSTLKAGVQLRSLHFDSLGLDFEGYPFPPPPPMPPVKVKTGVRNVV